MTPDEREATFRKIGIQMDRNFVRNLTRDELNRGHRLQGDCLAFALAAIEVYDFDRHHDRFDVQSAGELPLNEDT